MHATFHVCWCAREDSNLHAVSGTATSRLRVYQFRHGRIHVDVWDWAVRESRLHPLSCSASLGTYNGWRLPSPLTQALPLDLNRSSVHTRCIRWKQV